MTATAESVGDITDTPEDPSTTTVTSIITSVSDRLPLTRVGWTVVGATVSSYLVGWRLGWIELMIIAAGGLTALLIAVPFVLGRSGLDLERVIDPDRVMRGEPAQATLAARAGSRPTRGVRVDDTIGDDVTSIAVPPMLPNGEFVTQYDLPTDQRRMVQIGPAAVTRRDPLDLLRRQVSHAAARTCGRRRRGECSAADGLCDHRGMEAVSDAPPSEFTGRAPSDRWCLG